jgi:hypothetical protein
MARIAQKVILNVYQYEWAFLDSGVSFGGQTALIFNMTEPRRFFLAGSDEQTFSFAFSPRAHKLSATQHLGKL